MRSIEKIKFLDECTGSGHGQKDMEFGLWVDNGAGFDAKGFISYSVSDSDGEPAITWIEVAPEDRRKGYATKMVLELQKKYPDTQINWGVSTLEGDALYQSLPKKKVVVPGIVEGQQQLASVRNQLADYQKRYEFFQEKNSLDIKETSPSLNVMKNWNVLHGLERELCIYEDMADHKIVFDTSICDPDPEETESICIWPDGMVCRQEDIESYGWAGDDFTQIEIPLDDDMYEFAQRFIEEQTNNFSPRPR
jgi:hypothetical protein